VNATAEAGGLVQGSAAGDVKNGPIEIALVRVAQTDGVPAFYAFAGGEYVVRPDLEVEIYVQIWTSNPTVQNPRLIVDWGDGERDNIGCGSCRLARTYRTEGRYRVTVTMDDRISGVTTRAFTLNVTNPVAPPTSGALTFSNGALISVPATGSGGPATPYPSAINVSGVMGRITSTTVTIVGYQHGHHEDMVLLLVAPNGQTVKLMDNVGQGRPQPNTATITFQDGAPAFPDGLLGAGSFTFRPSQDGDYNSMAAPAPNVVDGTTLSTLLGLDPNGAWQLFVFDQSVNGDIGQIAGGWSITFATAG
jgi:hypothetical protein